MSSMNLKIKDLGSLPQELVQVVRQGRLSQSRIDRIAESKNHTIVIWHEEDLVFIIKDRQLVEAKGFTFSFGYRNDGQTPYWGFISKELEPEKITFPVNYFRAYNKRVAKKTKRIMVRKSNPYGKNTVKLCTVLKMESNLKRLQSIVPKTAAIKELIVRFDYWSKPPKDDKSYISWLNECKYPVPGCVLKAKTLWNQRAKTVRDLLWSGPILKLTKEEFQGFLPLAIYEFQPVGLSSRKRTKLPKHLDNWYKLNAKRLSLASDMKLLIAPRPWSRGMSKLEDEDHPKELSRENIAMDIKVQEAFMFWFAPGALKALAVFLPEGKTRKPQLEYIEDDSSYQLFGFWFKELLAKWDNHFDKVALSSYMGKFCRTLRMEMFQDLLLRVHEGLLNNISENDEFFVEEVFGKKPVVDVPNSGELTNPSYGDRRKLNRQLMKRVEDGKTKEAFFDMLDCLGQQFHGLEINSSDSDGTDPSVMFG